MKGLRCYWWFYLLHWNNYIVIELLKYRWNVFIDLFALTMTFWIGAQKEKRYQWSISLSTETKTYLKT